MLTMSNQNQPALFESQGSDFSSADDENRLLKKIKQSPFLPVATAGFLGIAGWRLYQARNRGGEKISFYLIHTRLAAQGLAVGVLGCIVFHSLGQRIYKSITHQQSDAES